MSLHTFTYPLPQRLLLAPPASIASASTPSSLLNVPAAARLRLRLLLIAWARKSKWSSPCRECVDTGESVDARSMEE